MKGNRAPLLAAILIVASAALAQRNDYPSIKNFLRLDDRTCTGGQPTLRDLGQLRSEGVKAVLNLREPREFNAAREAVEAKQLGLRYFLIPVNSDHPKDSQVAKFLKILDDPENRPIFIHCRTASRVGAFWMIRRVLVDGWPVERAEAEAKRIGLENPRTEKFALDYIRRHARKASSPAPPGLPPGTSRRRASCH